MRQTFKNCNFYVITEEHDSYHSWYDEVSFESKDIAESYCDCKREEGCKSFILNYYEMNNNDNLKSLFGFNDWQKGDNYSLLLISAMDEGEVKWAEVDDDTLSLLIKNWLKMPNPEEYNLVWGWTQCISIGYTREIEGEDILSHLILVEKISFKEAMHLIKELRNKKLIPEPSFLGAYYI